MTTTSRIATAICVALRDLSQRGVACYVMHGNRDFLYQSGFARRTGARLIADPIIIDLYGEPALLTHGDALCTADRPYQLLRGVVRSARWQQRFLRLPLAAAAQPCRSGAPRQPAPYATHRQPDHGCRSGRGRRGDARLRRAHADPRSYPPAGGARVRSRRPPARAASCSAPGTIGAACSPGDRTDSGWRSWRGARLGMAPDA